MTTYLENLTLRLATGTGRVPKETRDLHAKFLLGKQNSDGGFGGREGGSDLYYTGFALRGIAILGELHGEAASRAAEFVQSRMQGQAAIIDFLSLLYSIQLLENAAGIEVLAAAPEDWPTRVAAEMERFRRDDGGYAMSDEGFSSSTYYTFLVLLCRQLIGLEPEQPRRLIDFLLSRRREDGGFVEQGPMRNSGTNPTAAAIGALTILDAVDEDVREGAIDYLCLRQNEEGGLAANTRIPFADVLSTFTGLLTLGDLNAMEEIDLDAARGFLRSVQAEEGGFVAGLIDEVADVEYTFYGIGAMALLAEEPADEEPVDE